MFTSIATLVSLKTISSILIAQSSAIGATQTTPLPGSNGYNYYIFKGNGSITFTNPSNVALQILCVAGGGGGGGKVGGGSK